MYEFDAIVEFCLDIVLIRITVRFIGISEEEKIRYQVLLMSLIILGTTFCKTDQ